VGDGVGLGVVVGEAVAVSVDVPDGEALGLSVPLAEAVAVKVGDAPLLPRPPKTSKPPPAASSTTSTTASAIERLRQPASLMPPALLGQVSPPVPAWWTCQAATQVKTPATMAYSAMTMTSATAPAPGLASA